MIDWLNTNQGFVMSLLTMVYVVATIIIVVFNRKTIKEMKDSREAESRPYVFIYLDKIPRETHCFLRIKNYGKSGAQLNDVSITPNLTFNKGALPRDFLSSVILAPSQSLEFLVFDVKDEILENSYTVHLQYMSVDGNKKQYKDDYILLMNYIPQLGYIGGGPTDLSSEAKELQRIGNQLDSIKHKL